MSLEFYPECYFDTVLVKHILQAKRVNHKKSCNEVINGLKESRDFAVGIIDKDKKEVHYLRDCTLEMETESLYLWKHKDKQQFIIQLAPAIEQWILNVIREANVEVEDLNLPKNAIDLRKLTKYKFVSENEELKKLCKRLVSSNSNTMSILKSWLNYLLEKRHDAKIEEIKELR